MLFITIFSSAFLLCCPPLLQVDFQASPSIPLIGSIEFTPLYQDGRLDHPRVKGAWSRVGYGDFLLIEDQQARIFGTSSAGCWEIPGEATTELLLGENPGQDRCLVTTHPLEAPYLLERVGELPAPCTSSERETPRQIFELFAATLSDHYPFFELRGFDWKERVRAARAALGENLGDKALFALLSDSLNGLGDGHVYLAAEIEGELQTSTAALPLAIQRLSDGIDPELPEDEFEARFEELQGELFSAIRNGLFVELLGGKGSGSGIQSHGWIEGFNRIGYLGLLSMFDDDYDDLDAMLESVHASVDEALGELDGMRALVIDLSLNGGGTDAVSHAIANHFVARTRLAYTKGPASRPELRYGHQVVPAASQTYTGPIYLVTSGFTASAAEVFVLCLKDEPHVTLVGQPSGGGYSDVVTKTLPNGWEFGISIESYEDASGTCFEGRGVAVDVELPVFGGENLHTSHLETLLSVAELANQTAAPVR